MLVWDAAGRPTVLGKFGAPSASAMFNNRRGDISGILTDNGSNFGAFLWSPGRGVVRAGPNTVVTALNQEGTLAGRVLRPNGITRAYLFSRARGLVDLHPRAFLVSEAAHLNDSGMAVGLASNSVAGTDGRALRWSRSGAATDLNTRLLNAPAGLVLTEGRAIAANGDIVAASNAGLVLLRWGGRGTDAPVLGPIQVSEPAAGQPARLSLSFRDRNLRDTHTATVDWGDGTGPQPAAVREYKGKGEVRAEHRFASKRAYRVVVRVTDSTRKSTALHAEVLNFPVRR